MDRRKSPLRRRAAPNGEYDLDRGFHESVVRPFVGGYFEEKFQGDVESYGSYYEGRERDPRTDAGVEFRDDFNTAFHAEYGLLPDETVTGFAELMDLVLERQNVIVETTLDELRCRLTEKRGLSQDVCDAFIECFAIFSRARWKEPPGDFRHRDLYPWRFRRPLSLIVRPLLAFGRRDTDSVLFGAATLRIAASYLVGKARAGTLPQSFFRTAAMRAYAGKMNERRGRAFTQTVSQRLQDAGWQTRTEVKMTELGAPPDYGDIDVVFGYRVPRGVSKV